MWIVARSPWEQYDREWALERRGRRPAPPPGGSGVLLDELAQDGDAGANALFGHRGEAQPQRVGARLAGIERRARHESHVLRDRLGQQLGAVDVLGQRYP